jgi:hypothetical protein
MRKTESKTWKVETRLTHTLTRQKVWTPTRAVHTPYSNCPYMVASWTSEGVGRVKKQYGWLGVKCLLGRSRIPVRSDLSSRRPDLMVVLSSPVRSPFNIAFSPFQRGVHAWSFLSCHDQNPSKRCPIAMRVQAVVPYSGRVCVCGAELLAHRASSAGRWEQVGPTESMPRISSHG